MTKCMYTENNAMDSCPKWARPATVLRYCKHERGHERCVADWSDYGPEACLIKPPVALPPPLGSKFDDGKPRWSLLPWRELHDVVRVLTMGAEKYSRDNWKHVGDGRERYSDAMMRHFTAWVEGERVDAESGITHLAHVVCCTLFLMWFDAESKTGL